MSNEMKTVVGFGILLDEKHLENVEDEYEILEELYKIDPKIEYVLDQGGTGRIFLTYEGHYLETDRYAGSFIKKVPNIMGAPVAVSNILRRAALKFYPHELKTDTYYMVVYN